MSAIYYRSGSDFRLGGRQWDTCPHKHRTVSAAAACDHWHTYKLSRTVVVECTTAAGRELHLGVIEETPLEVAAREHTAARAGRDTARDVLAQAVRDAVAGGMTEVEAAKISGVDRMTVRKWVGK
jgi:hypothetical protein